MLFAGVRLARSSVAVDEADAEIDGRRLRRCGREPAGSPASPSSRLPEPRAGSGCGSSKPTIEELVFRVGRDERRVPHG